MRGKVIVQRCGQGLIRTASYKKGWVGWGKRKDRFRISINKLIQSRAEREANREILFLVFNICRQDNGQLRKPTQVIQRVPSPDQA